MGCDVYWVGVTCVSLAYNCGCYVCGAFTRPEGVGSFARNGRWLAVLCLDCLTAGRRAYQGRVQWRGANEARLFGSQSHQCSTHSMVDLGPLTGCGDAGARCGAGFPAQDQPMPDGGRTSWGAKILFDPKWPPHCSIACLKPWHSACEMAPLPWMMSAWFDVLPVLPGRQSLARTM
eukprot:2154245-Amphidinium_carterae.1